MLIAGLDHFARRTSAPAPNKRHETNGQARAGNVVGGNYTKGSNPWLVWPAFCVCWQGTIHAVVWLTTRWVVTLLQRAQKSRALLGQIRPSASLQRLPDTPHRASRRV